MMKKRELSRGDDIDALTLAAWGELSLAVRALRVAALARRAMRDRGRLTPHLVARVNAELRRHGLTPGGTGPAAATARAHSEADGEDMNTSALRLLANAAADIADIREILGDSASAQPPQP